MDDGGALEGIIQEGENDQRDGERIEEDQHRHRRGNDGGEPEIGDAAGQQGKDRRKGPGGHLRDERMEEGCHGGHEADARGEARQHDDHRQQHRAGLTEVPVHGAHDDGHAVFLQAQRDHRGRADEAEEDVDDAHEEHGHDARFQGVPRDGVRLLHAGEAHRFNDEDAEEEARQTVHGVVPFHDARREGGHRVREAGVRGGLPFSEGIQGVGREERKEQDQHDRREDLAHAVHQLRGRHREPPGEHKKDHGIGEEGRLIARADEGRHGHFKGRGARAGDGEERSDGEGDRRHHENAVPRVDPAGDVLEVLAGPADRDDPEERQAASGDEESRDGRDDVQSCMLAQEGREDDVARAEEEGEEHEADGDERVVVFHGVILLTS